MLNSIFNMNLVEIFSSLGNAVTNSLLVSKQNTSKLIMMHEGIGSPIKVKTTIEWLIGKLYVVKSKENHCYGDSKGANQLQRGEAIVNILAI